MSTSKRHEQLLRDLAELKLHRIAEVYQEVLNEAARKGSSMLDVLIGATGLGKTHLLNALGYTACEKGITVRFTRVVNMINTLTTAQMNGTLATAIIDRLMHHGEAIVIQGDSYRTKDKPGN